MGGLQCRECDEPEASNELGGGNDDEKVKESVEDVSRDPEEGDETSLTGTLSINGHHIVMPLVIRSHFVANVPRIRSHFNT